MPSSFVTRPGSWSSRCQSSYLAQALKCQFVRPTAALGVADKDRAGIARPAAIGGPGVEAHLIEIGAGALEHAGHALLQSPRSRRSGARARARRAGARSPRRATGWTETFPASPQDCAARRAMWPRAAPTRRACGSRACGVFDEPAASFDSVSFQSIRHGYLRSLSRLGCSAERQSRKRCVMGA